MSSLAVAWAWCKKYAWIVFAVLSFVLAYLVFRKPSVDGLSSVLDGIRQRHEEELAKIRAADLERAKRYEENQRALEETLSKVDERYKRAMEQLSATERERAAEIVRQHGADPTAVAEILAKEFGLTLQEK